MSCHVAPLFIDERGPLGITIFIYFFFSNYISLLWLTPQVSTLSDTEISSLLRKNASKTFSSFFFGENVHKLQMDEDQGRPSTVSQMYCGWWSGLGVSTTTNIRLLGFTDIDRP